MIKELVVNDGEAALIHSDKNMFCCLTECYYNKVTVKGNKSCGAKNIRFVIAHDNQGKAYYKCDHFDNVKNSKTFFEILQELDLKE